MAVSLDKPDVALRNVGEITGLFSQVVDGVYRPLGGVPNVTLRAMLESGPAAVRVCNNGYTSVPHLVCEVELLRHLERSGYPFSPRLLCGLDGRVIQKWGGYRVIAMRLIDGVRGDRVNRSTELCWEVGYALGLMRVMTISYSHGLPPDESYRARSGRLVAELPELVYALRWPVDAGLVAEQWKAACEDLERCACGTASQAIHTDVWPPNVICDDGHLVGIVDFDDFSFGPPVLDLSAALSEFAFSEDELIKDYSLAMFDGYRSSGATLTAGERNGIVSGIVASYAGWLSCNAVHGVPFEESAVYYRRLRYLRTSDGFETTSRALASCAP